MIRRYESTKWRVTPSAPTRPAGYGLRLLMDVKDYAASILGRKTDIMTRDSLHKALREAIEATAVRVF
jgi:predicted nucleotidyltransferase